MVQQSVLRPWKHLVLGLAFLLVWGIVSSLIEIHYAVILGETTAPISTAAYWGLIENRPYWRFLAIFVVLAGVVADNLRRKKICSSQIWGGAQPVVEPSSATSTWIWLCAAISTLFGGFLLTSRIQSHYFLQDDNYSQFLPGILHGCRTFWTSGEWPTWNPYQLMGSPLTDLGIYSLTYPITHLSYLLARLLGDETWLLDIFVCFHLTLACVLTYLAGRRLQLSSPVAAAVSVCFSMSGFALLVSRSWYYMSPAVASLPAIVLLALHFPNAKPGWRWTLATGSTIGLLFHAGNAQMWLYAVGFLFFLLALRVWQQNAEWRKLGHTIPALLTGLALAVPLLIPQALVTRGVWRAPFGEGIIYGLMSLVYPFPFANSPIPNRGMDATSPTGEYYYAGTLFTLAWIIGLSTLLVARGSRQAMKNNPLIPASLVAFLLALGHQGGLWTLHTVLPVLKELTAPAKFLVFFHFFSLMVGAMLVERFICGHKQRGILQMLCFGLTAGLMLYHANLSREALYIWRDSPNYSATSGILETLKGDGKLHRIYPAATDRTPQRGYVNSLNHNFPSLFKISSLEGYEPLWESRAPMNRVVDKLARHPLETLRAYGVEFVVMHRTAHQEQLSPGGRETREEKLANVPQVIAVEHALRGATAVFHSEDVDIFRVDGAEPLARSIAHPETRMDVRVEGNRLVVDTANLPGGGKILVNYLWHSGMTASAAGTELALSADDWNRIVIEVPAGSKTIDVAYRIGYQLPLLAGLVLLVAGIYLQTRFPIGWLLQSQKASHRHEGISVHQKLPGTL